MNFNPNNPATYKPARKKQYDIHMGLPALEAVFCNKFEQPQVATRYPFQPGRCLLTGRDVYHLQKYARKRDNAAEQYARLKQWASQGLLYTASSKTKDRVILAGTQGELWTIKLNKLAQTYDIVNSDNSVSPITPQSLSAKMVNGEMDWTRIRTKKDASVVMACFVPVGYQMQITTSWGAVLTVNANGVPHGKGDFIMASRNPDGTPNMNDRWVVNGLIFRDTYDNRGWSDYLEAPAADATQQQVRLPNLEIGESLYYNANEEFIAKVDTAFGESAGNTPVIKFAAILAGNIDAHRDILSDPSRGCYYFTPFFMQFAGSCSEACTALGAQYRTPEVVTASKKAKTCYSKFDFVRYGDSLKPMLLCCFFSHLVNFYCSGSKLFKANVPESKMGEIKYLRTWWKHCADFLAKYPGGMANWVANFANLPSWCDGAMTPVAVGRFFRVELFPALGEISDYHAYLTLYEYKEKSDSPFYTMKADLILRNVHGLDMTNPKNIRVFDDHEIELQESLNPYTMLGYGSNAMLAATRKKIASFVRGLSMCAGITGWQQYR